MMQLNPDDLAVTSFQTAEPFQLSAAACTPTLDSLVEHLCPDGITVGCRDPLLAE